MKGTWAYALTLAVLLTGCGAKPDAAQEPAETAAQTAMPEPVTDVQTTPAAEVTEALTTEAATDAPTTVLTEAASAETAAVTTAAPAGTDGKAAVIASYKTAINEKIEESKVIGSEYAGGNYSIDYALYDMDHSGTPELLIRYGTCEADYRIAVYTCRDGGLVKLADDIGGSHISFGYDTESNQLVMMQGHMGYGDLYWYDLDGNGALRELKNAGGFAFGMEGQPEYDDILKENHVAYLPSSSTYSFGDEVRTTIYDGSDSYNIADEFLELNFKLLEDYQF